MLDRHFKLAESQTSIKQEMLGGLTTFVTMAYIIVVNPQILSQAGMPAEGVVFATCLSAAVATLVMGLYANYPIALAPGMSLNAYFTYSVCMAMHIPWQTALAVVFFSGLLFLILTVTRIREQIVNGMPDCMKHSTAAGIGMFIAFVGLRNAKLVVANSATFVGLGSFADKGVQTACLGLALTVVLVARRVHAAFLLGIANSITERLVRLITDILDRERRESGRASLQIRQLELREVVAQSVSCLWISSTTLARSLAFASREGLSRTARFLASAACCWLIRSEPCSAL